MLERMWRKGNPSALLAGMQTAAATVENRMEFPQKTKNALPFYLAIPLLGLYPKNPETSIQNNLFTPMFIAAMLIATMFLAIYNSQVLEVPISK